MFSNFTTSLAFKIMRKFHDLISLLSFEQVSLHTIFCLIAGVLSLHLVFLFLGRESDSREIYKAKCQSNFKGSCEFVIRPLLLRFNSFPATNYSQLDCHPRLQLLKIHFLWFLGIDLGLDHVKNVFHSWWSIFNIFVSNQERTFLLEKPQRWLVLERSDPPGSPALRVGWLRGRLERRWQLFRRKYFAYFCTACWTSENTYARMFQPDQHRLSTSVQILGSIWLGGMETPPSPIWIVGRLISCVFSFSLLSQVCGNYCNVSAVCPGHHTGSVGNSISCRY